MQYWFFKLKLSTKTHRDNEQDLIVLHYKREKRWYNEILSFTINFYSMNTKFSCCFWVLAQTLAPFWWKGGGESLTMLGFTNRTSIQCIYATKRLRKAGHDHCQVNFSFCHIVRSHDVDLLTLLTWPGQYWLTCQLFDLIDRGSTGSRQHWHGITHVLLK